MAYIAPHNVLLAHLFFFSYKHVFDGLYQVGKFEGLVKLFNGATMASTRAICVTVGQIACYDQIKGMLINTVLFPSDNPSLHFTSSFLAVSNVCMFCPISESKESTQLLVFTKWARTSDFSDTVIRQGK